ncbi:type 4 pilus major pilin [Brenneria populi]|uniref:Type 4 pilus major pilin n=1 Tax=Brenneria populi TaxID=1505588 RepID=A0ABU6JRJ8_9GAMM|nr:type 4 pilus major pilin [Brenneria populi Li et al. 2015]
MILLKKRKSKKGFSLLELLLVLGIIAALVVAAFIVYPKVQSSQRATAESNNIATIQAGVKALYTAASSYSGLNETVAVQAKIFPDNMLSGSGSAAKPVNAFKGNVLLGTSTDSPSGVANSAFTITYVDVPALECTKIVSGVGANFYSVAIGTGSSALTTGNIRKASSDMNMATVASTCQSGGNSNTITFTSL